MLYNVLLLVAVIGGVLNCVWEYLHFSLYRCRFSYSLLVGATVGDIGMLLGIYGLTALLFRDWLWLSSLSLPAAGFVLAASVVTAVLLEWIALHERYWEYTEAMPVVPWLSVGVSPVLQLAFTPLATFVVVYLLLW